MTLDNNNHTHLPGIQDVFRIKSKHNTINIAIIIDDFRTDLVQLDALEPGLRYSYSPRINIIDTKLDMRIPKLAV